MSDEAKLFETLELSNGLLLELYDASRRVFGDRWHLTLIARIEVDPALFQELAIANKPTPSTLLGDRVIFEQRREREFVGNDEKGAAFGELRQWLLSVQRPYLEHPDFARRLVRRRYMEALSNHPD